mgnify:CR=1 FL=1
MKVIYIAHSRDFDFKHDLYKPIRNSALNSQHKIIFPHETDQFINSKAIIKRSQLVIAEVSHSAIGVGIELGWANSFNVPILCLYKEGSNLSKSLEAVAGTIVPYASVEEMLIKLESFLSQ